MTTHHANDPLAQPGIVHVQYIVRWFSHFLLVLTALSVAVALFSPSLLAITFMVFTAVASLVTLATGKFVARKAVRPATVIASLFIITISIGLALVGGSALTIVALHPVLIYILISEWVPIKHLRLVCVMFLFASLALLSVNLWLPLEFAISRSLMPAVIGATIVTQALILLMVRVSREYTDVVLKQAINAHAALQTTYDHMEQLVTVRTQELSESVALLQSTLDSTADGILVVDEHEGVVIWNNTFVEMWRISPALLASRDQPQIAAALLSQVADPLSAQERWQTLTQGPLPQGGVMIFCKDGRVLERHARLHLVDGIRRGLVLSYRDVTEHTRAKKRDAVLVSLGQRLSMATSVTAATHIIIDVADQVLTWDSCYIDLFNEQDNSLETVVCIDVVDNQRVNVPLPPIGTLGPLENRIMREGALLILRPQQVATDDELVPFGDTGRRSKSLMYVPIRRGTTSIGVLSVQSYTPNAYTNDDLNILQGLGDHCGGALERIRTQAALRQEQEDRLALERKLLETQKLESLGVLAGGIAHDFNNLLAVILGNSSMAQLDLPPHHPASENIEQISLAATRAADLTGQMLAYAGKGKRSIGLVMVNSLIAEMGKLLSASLPKQVAVRYELANDLPAVQGDATQLRQVIMNLLTNAAEASGSSGGLVVLRTNIIDASETLLKQSIIGNNLAVGRYVAIEVEDHGCGMDGATLAKIFEPFFSTKFTGRGLGLAAVLGIVRSHGGAIQVQSTPKVGTLFRVLLPPDSAYVATTSVVGHSQNEAWTGDGQVLIIDDEPPVLSMAERMVRHFGIQTMAATTGLGGIELFRSHHASLKLVLLDVTMPELSVQQVLNQLQIINPAVPVLLISGYSEHNARSLVDAPQVVGFLQKPFLLSELGAALRQIIDQPTATLHK